MKDFGSEFQALSHFYREIREEFSSALNEASGGNSSVATAVLKSGKYISKIGEMNSRVMQLLDDWDRNSSSVNSESRTRINVLADTARQEAMQLDQLLCAQIQKIQGAQDSMSKDLDELGKGRRYLKSQKPATHNYPKFIDSLY